MITAKEALDSAVKGGTREASAALSGRAQRIAQLAATMLSARLDADDGIEDELSAAVCDIAAKHTLSPGELAFMLVTLAEAAMGSVLASHGLENRALVKKALIAIVELDE